MSESQGDFWRRKVEEFREGKVKECPVCATPSNPKPVEGALRDLVARWRSKEFAKLIDLEDSRCTEDICADELEAALSAAPAPTIDEKRQSMLSERDRAAREKVLNALDRAVRHDDVNVTVMTQDLYATMNAASEAAAPARDGVRRLEAAMDMRMAVRQAFDVIAKANTVTGLSLAEMEQVVIKELQDAAAKEQADGHT